MKRINSETLVALNGPIAIQGYPGSFHEEAASRYYGRAIDVFPCDSFSELVHITQQPDRCAGAVMAIENSIAGSILPNYNLLHRSKLIIVGEIYLRIRQQLLALPGVSIEQIRSVHSHTMALQQCSDFLEQHKWKLVETEDTAKSAQLLQQQKSKTTAVVAGRQAAERYGLNVLASNIHTAKNNYTRFLVLKRKEGSSTFHPQADKASLLFHTDHQQGALAKVLNRIAAEGINLSKLQSFPIPGTQFNYAFHADLEFDHIDRLNATINTLQAITQKLHVYGIYKKGSWK